MDVPRGAVRQGRWSFGRPWAASLSAFLTAVFWQVVGSSAARHLGIAACTQGRMSRLSSMHKQVRQ